MAKKKVFVSFDFEHDNGMKGSLISQSERPDSPFSINDFSLKQGLPNDIWISKAQQAISKCDIFIVLLGPNTHSAPGVLLEVKIAKGLKKDRFQLRPKGKSYGEVLGGGDLVSWQWKNIMARFS
jgi:hypothetical protein